MCVRQESALPLTLLATSTMFVCSIALSAQQPRPVFRGATDLVQVDAVVVDTQGRTVGGLTREDFVLLDRGQRREIALFEEVSHDRPDDWRTRALVRQDVADNYSARSDRLIVLVLDDLHFQAKTDEVRDIARRVVTELGDRATLGLVTTSGTFGVEPTEDRTAILEAIDAFVDKFDPEGRFLDPRMHYVSPPNLIAMPGAPDNLGRFYGDMTQFKVIEDVARRVGSDDARRKAFVWISGGGRAGGPAAYEGAVAGAVEALRKSNVASYGVHTGDFSKSALKVVADASGGFVADTRHLESGLAQIVSELDHYYLLGFYPESTGKREKSEYRALELRVNRPGLTVRSRTAYQSGPPPKPPRNADPLVALSAGVLPKTALPLRVSAAQIAGVSTTSVGVALEVSVDTTTLPASAGSLRDTLNFTLLAVDRAKKKVVRRVTRETHVNLVRTAEGRAASVVRYQVLERLVLPPANYQLRVSATSAAARTGGSVYTFVDVIDLQKRHLALGGVVLGASARQPIASHGSDLLLPFAPVLDRSFDRSDQLRIYCDLLRRERGRLIAATVTLVDERGVEVVSVPKTIGPGDRDVLDLSMGLANVPSGSYRLTVAVADGENAAEQVVGIVVK